MAGWELHGHASRDRGAAGGLPDLRRQTVLE
jgi:hypothetical protein